MRWFVSPALTGAVLVALAGAGQAVVAAADPPSGAVVRIESTWGCLTNNNVERTSMTKCVQGSRNQRWAWTPAADKTVRLRNVATGRCLDSDAKGTVYTSRCDVNDRALRWRTPGPDNSKRFYSSVTNRYLRTNAFNDLYATDTDRPTDFKVTRIS
ncbi:RICIN domain-containing protein [Actinomadura harenae]|uniref:Ricin B lectin domain-containing protein n=1 Tax=Actinomadura harenae TaxID=2483351 RepID=A0A3M2LTX0_9ACTN|nr:RICIN domain-containing protein [Actinomadura harenae]RMI38348.1 hypothetical protein EBO15_33105 [Actinomadura harenae]